VTGSWVSLPKRAVKVARASWICGAQARRRAARAVCAARALCPGRGRVSAREPFALHARMWPGCGLRQIPSSLWFRGWPLGLVRVAFGLFSLPCFPTAPIMNTATLGPLQSASVTFSRAAGEPALPDALA
jgi:hypothetical protein